MGRSTYVLLKFVDGGAETCGELVNTEVHHMVPSHAAPRPLFRTVALLVAVAAVLTHAIALAPHADARNGEDRLITVDSDAQFAYALENKTGAATATGYFGSGKDQPLIGDWNCDGTATPGVYRSKFWHFYLSNDLQSGVTNADFYFGNPGDIALAGDFNGDGCDTVALYRPSTATFYLRNSLTSGSADVTVAFGNPGDKPFVGDFDGDGRDTFGVYRKDRVYLSNDLTRRIAQQSFVYGNPGDKPIAGDWAGSGKDSLALYRPSTGWVYFQNGLEAVYVGPNTDVLSATVGSIDQSGGSTLPSIPAKPAPKPSTPSTPSAPSTPPSNPAPAPPQNYDVDVELYPGDDIAAAARNNPAGTVFRINGEHFGQNIDPKDGQVFVGAPGARLVGNGAGAAFDSDADNVTIDGFEITGYMPRKQAGVIHGFGDRWVVRNNNIHHNGAVGVRLANGNQGLILDNIIHHNEQLGISVAFSTDTVVQGNEIAFNNHEVKYSWGWEAGGTKFWSTTNLIVRGNHSHDNHGPGLWTDHDNVGTVYEGNLVEDNYAAGIFHEISYSATIRDNTIRRNGFGHAAWVWGGGITIAASQDVEVYGNLVEDNFNGITMAQQDRGSGSLGPWIVRNNYVHDNTIRNSGVSGVAQDIGTSAVFNSGNRFDRNTYIGDVGWEYDDGRVGWDTWRSFGNDGSGSFSG